MKFKDMLAFGIIIWLVGTGIGAWMIHQSNRNRSSERIQQLQDTISLKNEETQNKQAIIDSKQDRLTEISDEILELSKKLDTNTVTLNDVFKEIKAFTLNTNKISQAIQNEQKEKGQINFNIEDSDYYHIYYGENKETISKKRLLEGRNVKFFLSKGFPLYLKLLNNSILISTSLRDENNRLIIEMENSKWALSKTDNFSINYDKTGLEILNSHGMVIFQMDIRMNSLYFKGVFYVKNEILLFDNGASFMPYNEYNILRSFHGGIRIKRISFACLKLFNLLKTRTLQ